jgi:hypothetical protein
MKTNHIISGTVSTIAGIHSKIVRVIGEVESNHQWPSLLTLLCQDHPKMGDSMTCKNFAFGDLSMLAPKPSRTGWLVFIESPKMGDSMKMLSVAHSPLEEFWFS